MLPYGTGNGCYAFIYYFKFPIASVYSFLKYFFSFKSGIDKSTEWSTITARPSPMCFFSTGAIPKELILRKYFV